MKKLVLFLVLQLITFQLLTAQDLQSYIRLAEDNNPEIQAYLLRYNISQEKVNELDALPNTQFSVGYFLSEPETRTGPQRARFSVSQMLPWFGTIPARQNTARAMAEVDYQDFIIAKRKLGLSIANSYYKLYSLKSKLKVLGENRELLSTYEQLALTSLEVNRASAVDVLKLQIRQNELQQQKEIMEEELVLERLTFNNLLNRDENVEVELVQDLSIPITDPEVITDSLSVNPELVKFNLMYESVVTSEALNQKESAPSFGFGLDYIPVSERTDMNFSDNGKDIIMPMISLSIPIFSNKFSSVSKQNELRQLELESQKSNRLNTLETALFGAIAERNQARIKFNIQSKNLGQAKDAEEILIKNYETGTIDFNDLLDIQELQIKFNLNQIDAVVAYYRQSAIINYLINK